MLLCRVRRALAQRDTEPRTEKGCQCSVSQLYKHVDVVCTLLAPSAASLSCQSVVLSKTHIFDSRSSDQMFVSRRVHLRD